MTDIAFNKKKGLLPKYRITKANGQPMDEGAEYFVLRLDDGGGDKRHIEACRAAILTYAEQIADHLPLLAKDIIEKYGTK